MADEAAQWLRILQRLWREIQGTDVSTLEVEARGFRLRIRRNPGASLPPSSGGPRDEPLPRDSAGPAQDYVVSVRAPIAGVFYCSPSPGARPYVMVGDQIEPGTVIGLIETMKIFNEITTDHAGTVVEVKVQSGELVQGGDVLVVLLPMVQPSP